MKPTSAALFEGAKPLPPSPPPDVHAFAKALLAAHHAREAFMREASLADPTWAMLLDLFISHAQEGRLSLSDLYSSVPVPKATTLRTINRLVDKGLLITEDDPGDGRRTLVQLTDHSYRQMFTVVEHMHKILTSPSSGPSQLRP